MKEKHARMLPAATSEWQNYGWFLFPLLFFMMFSFLRREQMLLYDKKKAET